MTDNNEGLDVNQSDSSNDSNNENNNATNNNAGKTVVIGCDTNNSNDKTCQDTVARACEAAGYKPIPLSIGPNEYATYSYSADAKGKLGVYLMAASLLSFLDAAAAGFDYNVLGIRGDVTEWTDQEWETKQIPKDHHGDCTIPECDTYQGKTYPELNEIFKGKCIAVPGETNESLAQHVVEALGGQYNGLAGGTNTGSSSGGAQIKDKTFEDCIRRICAATDSVFLVENNAAVLFPYTDWMAFTLRHQIKQIKAKDMDPDLFEIDYNTDGFYNKVTVVWGRTKNKIKLHLINKMKKRKKKKEMLQLFKKQCLLVEHNYQSNMIH